MTDEQIQVVEGFDYDPAHPPVRTWEATLLCPTCGPVKAQVPAGAQFSPCPKCGTAAERQAFSVIGQLKMNVYARPRSEYVEAGGSSKIIQWRQEFDAQDIIRSDGTVPTYSNTVNVTDKDGAKLGEGSAAQALGLYYEGLGVHINPSDPRAKEYNGHFFKLESTEVKMGKRFTKRILKPVLYYGAQCPPITEKRVIEASGGESGDSSVAPAAVASATNDEETARKLAELCDGRKPEEVFNLALASMGTVSKLFDLPFFGGLAAPSFKLLDEMVSRGYLTKGMDGTLSKAAA